jgi:hypothetical protein
VEEGKRVEFFVYTNKKARRMERREDMNQQIKRVKDALSGKDREGMIESIGKIKKERTYWNWGERECPHLFHVFSIHERGGACAEYPLFVTMSQREGEGGVVFEKAILYHYQDGTFVTYTERDEAEMIFLRELSDLIRQRRAVRTEVLTKPEKPSFCNGCREALTRNFCTKCYGKKVEQASKNKARKKGIV